MSDEGTIDAFGFNLHLVCGGFAYFSTYSEFAGRSSDGHREIRKPSLIIAARILDKLKQVNAEPRYIDGEDELQFWLLHRGWGIINNAFVRSRLSNWLKKKETIQSALRTYTDIVIASDSAINQRVRPGMRDSVQARDGKTCLLCGRSSADGIPLTMDHVQPHSQGGETTTGNLVTLCQKCNELKGDTNVQRLYDLAGLPHGFDPSLIRGTASQGSLLAALMISSNLLHTRAEVF